MSTEVFPDASDDVTTNDDVPEDDSSVATTGEMDVVDSRQVLGYWTYNGIAMQYVSGRLYGSLSLDDRHAGSPGWASSGVIANLLDELLICAVGPYGLAVTTKRMETDYLAPVPLHEPLALSAWVTYREGRQIFTAAALHSHSRILAQAVGTFIVVG